MEPKPFTVYEHYKGGRYIVLVIADHTETGEKLVVYMSLTEDHKFWVRPLSMWNEEVAIEMKDGFYTQMVIVPRFSEV